MTYSGYLALFLGGPLVGIAVLHAAAWQQGHRPLTRLGVLALLVHVVVAVVYTTPWDNYLVATGVWGYDPARVLGVTFGWVPLEEYTFFVLQTLLTGGWLLWLMGCGGSQLRRGARLAPNQHSADWSSWAQAVRSAIDRSLTPAARAVALLLVLVWLGAVAALLTGRQPLTYLALELGWFLPPIILQVAVGAQILWQERRLVALALLPPTLWLAASDGLAIGAGVWAISHQQTTGILVGGVLPLEELIFFSLTNTLIVFGMTLMIRIASASSSPRDM